MPLIMISKKMVKNMLLNDGDHTGDSKTVEDAFFLQNEIGIEEEKKTHGTKTKEIKYQYLRESAIVVWKRTCIMPLIVQSQRRIQKELIKKERMDKPALFCGKNNNMVTIDFARIRFKLKTAFTVQVRTSCYEYVATPSLISFKSD